MLADAFQGVEQAFEAVLRRGQELGEIRRDEEPAALARFLLSTIQGLRVLARGNPDEAVLRDVARIALAGLTPPDGHVCVSPPTAS